MQEHSSKCKMPNTTAIEPTTASTNLQKIHFVLAIHLRVSDIARVNDAHNATMM